jgi:hypothetical protein
MANEVPAKFVRFALARRIPSQVELRKEEKFRRKAGPGAGRDVIPLRRGGRAMGDELGRLRDVARAAAALLRAQADWHAYCGALLGRRSESAAAEDFYRQAGRLKTVAADHEVELVLALARLAELNHELVDG